MSWALLLLCLGGSRLYATPVDTNRSIRCQRVATVRQGYIDHLSIVDDRLCYRMGDWIYATPLSTLGAEGVDVAADLMAVDADMTYAVRHPATGLLYYTKPDREGTSLLYRHQPAARRNKAERVLPGGYEGMVCHPTFSTDGTVMVFAAPHDSLATMELYYSQWENEQWSSPKSLGGTINTAADEVNPCISGDYLYFGSNRGSDDTSRYALYMCRLVSTQKIQNDTIFSYPIGKGKVQRLPSPLSGATVQPAVVYDAQRHCGFWVQRSVAKDAPDELYAFKGELSGTLLSGTVRGTILQEDGRQTVASPLSEVCIEVYDAAYSSVVPLFCDYSDKQGRYSFYLQPDHTYRLLFRKKGYCDKADTLVTQRNRGDAIYELQRCDALLEGLRYHVDYVFDNHRSDEALFLPAVADAVSAAGRQRLQRMARYLIDNPETYLHLTVVYTEGTEAFNRLLATQRVESLLQLLWQEGVPQTTLSRVVYETVVTADAIADASNAVLFFFSDGPIVVDRDKQGQSLHYFMEQEKQKEESDATQRGAARKGKEMPAATAAPTAAEIPAAVAPLEGTGEEEEEEEPSEINPLFRQAVEQK